MRQLKQPQMVRWFNPTLLIRTGWDVLVSTIFGQHADQRLSQAFTGQPFIVDYSQGDRRSIPVGAPAPTDEKESAPTFWLDYVADVGDGWNSTYAIAWLLSRPNLKVNLSPAEGQRPRDPCRKAIDLPAGQVLIFGGDQVYPSASREEYEKRFIAPYRMAFTTGQCRDVYAIPGNHDWYDSLRSFSRIFLSGANFAADRDNDLPGCETPQRRSYFAIRLPHRWWLLATDVQLGSDIDGTQLAFFKAVAGQIADDERVILCTAEPYWLKPKRLQRREHSLQATAFDQLVEGVLINRKTLHSKVAVIVAGDLHHYMRYAADDQSQRITAGGGGAFLHPTHGPWPKEFQESDSPTSSRRFVRKACFPPRLTSWWLGCRNWAFPLLNVQFGLASALLYLVLSLIVLTGYNAWDQQEAQRVADARIAQEVQGDQALTPYSLDSATQPMTMRDAGRARLQRGLGDPAQIKRFEAIQQTYQQHVQRPLLSRPRPEAALRIPHSDPTTILASASAPAATQEPQATVHSRVWTAFRTIVLKWLALENPTEALLGLAIIVAVLCGFVLFSDLPNATSRAVLGTLHGLLHVAAAFACTLYGIELIRSAIQVADYLANPVLLAVLFAIGWIVGSFLMGLYLWFSLNICRRHWNAGFSSLRIQDWKSFLRMSISPDGTLTIFPIGLPKVPRMRSWRRDSSTGTLRPLESLMQPTLIEDAVVIPHVHSKTHSVGISG